MRADLVIDLIPDSREKVTVYINALKQHEFIRLEGLTSKLARNRCRVRITMLKSILRDLRKGGELNG